MTKSSTPTTRPKFWLIWSHYTRHVKPTLFLMLLAGFAAADESSSKTHGIDLLSSPSAHDAKGNVIFMAPEKNPLKAGSGAHPSTAYDLLSILANNKVPVTLETAGSNPFDAPVKMVRPIESIADVLALIETTTGLKSSVKGSVAIIHDESIEKRLGSDPLGKKMDAVEFHDATIYQALSILSKNTGFDLSPAFIAHGVMGKQTTFKASHVTLREALLQLSKNLGSGGFAANVKFLDWSDYPYPIKIDISL